MNDVRCIAVVDDDPGQRFLLDTALRGAGYATLLCKNGEEGIDAAPRCELMLLDVRMPGLDGLTVLKRVKETHPDLPVILLTAFIDVRDAVAAIKTGALDYLEKPVDLDELISAVDDALGSSGRPVAGADALALPAGIVAESPATRQIFEQARRVAESKATVLILGESGAGKEILAQFIHACSSRSGTPLITVDCGTLPKDLIESELFGHEKGAFTGAETQRKGRFEQADGGTLFLDEIGELPLALQPALLRVLESGEFRRVGGSQQLRADVRIIAATNRDLEKNAREGRFREDLFYRLNVFPIVAPPLRERRDDILPLAECFLRDRKQRLSPAAERLLVNYAWPGNLRELRNALERASILANGSLIIPSDLPQQIQAAPAEPEPVPAAANMREVQRRAILEALEKTGGNKTRAATLLGISRRNLIYKLRDYGL
ncbi:MAG: sigma-54-dependent Fis family transcriptional regulator [Candidatus Hydrogenedentes bacterium]|nr:sigma-54-dependent Fis family transcriptional regulator [Candidatus Hydrogenedentota bacterium]